MGVGRGGTFTLTGDVPSLGLVGATLIAGTFTGTENTPGLAGETTGLFFALGVDAKDPTLAAFYGLAPTGFTFANTEIALNTLTVDAADGRVHGDAEPGRHHQCGAGALADDGRAAGAGAPRPHPPPRMTVVHYTTEEGGEWHPALEHPPAGGDPRGPRGGGDPPPG